MIFVYCPMKQDDIIKEIEAFKIDNISQFKFIKKEGIKLIFTSKINDKNEACGIISGIIRGYKYGVALMFNVVPYEDHEVKWF